ncbi:unnamed protein product [Heterosigma akashiwo]
MIYSILFILAILQIANAFVGTPLMGARGSARTFMAVEKKDSYDITLLTGDGIGPEITQATVAALAPLEKLGFKMNFKEALIGGAALDAVNHPFPDESLEQCKGSDSVLLSCIGGYKWDKNPRELRPETGLLRMRKEMGLFANLRPAKVIPQLMGASTLKEEVLEGVDIMVVRELTGDVYFGTPKGTETRDGKRVAYNNMIYDEEEIRRIAKVAFDVAMKRGKNVYSIDKANVLDVSQLWRDVVIEESKNYPEVELNHMYADNARHAAHPVAQAVRHHRVRQPLRGYHLRRGLHAGGLPGHAAFRLHRRPVRPWRFEPCCGSARTLLARTRPTRWP